MKSIFKKSNRKFYLARPRIVNTSVIILTMVISSVCESEMMISERGIKGTSFKRNLLTIRSGLATSCEMKLPARSERLYLQFDYHIDDVV